MPRLLSLPAILALVPFLFPAGSEHDGPWTPATADPPFEHSKTCALCHSNSPRAAAMRDAEDRPIAPFDLWRASMKANSARDPLWRAVLSAEIAQTPSRKLEIQAKCMRCHTPMANFGTDFQSGDRGLDAKLTTAILDDPDDPRHDLAIDGVSCTVCHQIEPDGLGDAKSFAGRFHIAGKGRAYGPHADPFTMPMRHHSGFTPTRGEQILSSALCGSCHTLDTKTLDEDGEATGSVLPEQSPYLEWRNSIYTTETEAPHEAAASCQDCHVPKTDVDGKAIATRIAHNPGGRDWPFLQARRPFGRHVFVGGNTLLPEIFRDNAAALGVTAPRAAFDATIALVKDQLRRRTARLKLLRPRRDDGRLRFGVRVENITGHKLPSAYPSRRAWLHARVTDRDGRVVFESGGFDQSGRIIGADGRPLAAELRGPPLRHRDRITEPDQVQVFESVMGDEAGAPTFRLLRGAKYLKDNRILPAGWRADGPHAKTTAPIGVGGDASFVAGSDAVEYAVRVDPERGPHAIHVELVYQTLGARFATELFRFDTREVRAFRSFYEKATRTPVLVDSAKAKCR